MSSEYGTWETVKDRFWPWHAGKSLTTFPAVPSSLGSGAGTCPTIMSQRAFACRISSSLISPLCGAVLAHLPPMSDEHDQREAIAHQHPRERERVALHSRAPLASRNCFRRKRCWHVSSLFLAHQELGANASFCCSQQNEAVLALPLPLWLSLSPPPSFTAKSTYTVLPM